ncbi:RING-type E3 ubiquitin transferase [Sarracenia purpurea var. burkii]
MGGGAAAAAICGGVRWSAVCVCVDLKATRRWVSCLASISSTGVVWRSGLRITTVLVLSVVLFFEFKSFERISWALPINFPFSSSVSYCPLLFISKLSSYLL